MKRFSVIAIAVGLVIGAGACKKKAVDAGGGSDGSGSGSSMMAGSDTGSAGSGSAMVGSGSGSGSGSAMAGSAMAGSGSGSAAAAGSGSADTSFVTLISDETKEGGHEGDLKTETDKAVAQLSADVKDGKFGANIILKTLETGAKVTCSIEVDVFTQPDHTVFAPLVHSGEVTPEKGKEAAAPGDCFGGVLDHAIVSEVAQAIADKKAGKPDPVGAGADGSAGSAAAGSGSGSAAKK